MWEIGYRWENGVDVGKWCAGDNGMSQNNQVLYGVKLEFAIYKFTVYYHLPHKFHSGEWGMWIDSVAVTRELIG